MTYLQKYLQDHLDEGDDEVVRHECPHKRFIGAIKPDNCNQEQTPGKGTITCLECWNREIPEEKENKPMATTKKTKAQLLEEIEQHRSEIVKLKEDYAEMEKYRKYKEMANEAFAILESLMDAGFTREESFKFMMAGVKANT